MKSQQFLLELLRQIYKILSWGNGQYHYEPEINLQDLICKLYKI